MKLSEKYFEKINKNQRLVHVWFDVEIKRYGEYIRMETISTHHPEAWDRIHALDELKTMSNEDNL